LFGTHEEIENAREQLQETVEIARQLDLITRQVRALLDCGFLEQRVWLDHVLNKELENVEQWQKKVADIVYPLVHDALQAIDTALQNFVKKTREHLTGLKLYLENKQNFVHFSIGGVCVAGFLGFLQKTKKNVTGVSFLVVTC